VLWSTKQSFITDGTAVVKVCQAELNKVEVPEALRAAGAGTKPF